MQTSHKHLDYRACITWLHAHNASRHDQGGDSPHVITNDYTNHIYRCNCADEENDNVNLHKNNAANTCICFIAFF
jgi:hypothetical protein